MRYFWIILLFCINVQAEMMSIRGEIWVNEKNLRDTINNYIVGKSTNYWISNSTYSIKYVVATGTNPSHYDVDLDIRIIPKWESDRIETFLTNLTTNNKIIYLNLLVHYCQNDIGETCREKTWIKK